MTDTAVADDIVDEAAPAGGVVELVLNGPDGELGVLASFTFDGDIATIDEALAGIELAIDGAAPEAADLSAVTAALEAAGVTDAVLNQDVVDALPDGEGMYTVTVRAPEGEMIEDEMPAPDFKADEAVDGPKRAPWEGLMVVEGVKSGDGRMIEPGALSWRELPLPLMLMTENPVGGEGHDGARLAGRIEWIERRNDVEIWGGGSLDLTREAGREFMELLTPDETGMNMLRGVSVDLDDVELVMDGAEEFDSDDEGVGLRVGKGRVMGLTGTVFPSFQEAQIALVSEALAASLPGEGCDCEREAALVAAAGQPMEGAQVRVFTPLPYETGGAMVASGIPVHPPAAWFDLPPIDEIVEESVRVSPDGRIWGLCADSKSCHIGFAGRCVQVPRSRAHYRYFANKQTETAEGVMVATGPIMMDTVHPNLKLKASDAQAFYAHTGSAVADVAVYDTPKGMYLAGALRPQATPEQIRALRGSDISPDWRTINGTLECVALLAVNTSGFITPALAASGANVAESVEPGRVAAHVNLATGEVLSLVAAGMRHHQSTVTYEEFEALRAEVSSLRQQLGIPDLEQRRQMALERHHAHRQAKLQATAAAAVARIRKT